MQLRRLLAFIAGNCLEHLNSFGPGSYLAIFSDIFFPNFILLKILEPPTLLVTVRASGFTVGMSSVFGCSLVYT